MNISLLQVIMQQFENNSLRSLSQQFKQIRCATTSWVVSVAAVTSRTLVIGPSALFQSHEEKSTLNFSCTLVLIPQNHIISIALCDQLPHHLSTSIDRLRYSYTVSSSATYSASTSRNHFKFCSAHT